MNIEHLMNNEEFKAKLSAAENTAEMAEVFASYGVEVSEEELKEAMAPVTAGEGGELNEDALDMVSGGGFLDWLINWGRKRSKKNTEDINEAMNILF